VWRDTVREALEDAVNADCAEHDDEAPSGVRLDLMVQIQEETVAVSEWELWACAAEVLKQHGDNAPHHIAERIGALVLEGDMRGVAKWRSIALKLDQLQRTTMPIQ